MDVLISRLLVHGKGRKSEENGTFRRPTNTSTRSGDATKTATQRNVPGSPSDAAVYNLLRTILGRSIILGGKTYERVRIPGTS